MLCTCCLHWSLFHSQPTSDILFDNSLKLSFLIPPRSMFLYITSKSPCSSISHTKKWGISYFKTNCSLESKLIRVKIYLLQCFKEFTTSNCLRFCLFCLLRISLNYNRTRGTCLYSWSSCCRGAGGFRTFFSTSILCYHNSINTMLTGSRCNLLWSPLWTRRDWFLSNCPIWLNHPVWLHFKSCAIFA